MTHFPRLYHLGESCLCWALGNGISATTSRKVLLAYKSLKELQKRGELGVLDVVPSYDSLAVHLDPAQCDVEAVRARVELVLAEAAPGETAAGAGRRFELPVRYDGEDLLRVAHHAGLSRGEVARLHSEAVYHVAMIGFQPHFPYFLGLPPVLATPRLDTPRVRVPAGSVAIGGIQTGVYPRESPGGWNLIGTTDPARLTMLEPGDEVVFRAT